LRSGPAARETTRVRFGGKRTPTGYLFELTGGHLCLDLANTLDERSSEHPRELLTTYIDLLDWSVQSGALPAADAHGLRRHAAREPVAASTALRRVVAVREAIFEVFSAVAGGRAVPADALALLNQTMPAALAHRCLEGDKDAFCWAWRPAAGVDLSRMLWPVVWSAAELLTSPLRDRVRRCEGRGCAWLFIDTSRNRTRRWCDMSVCGNRLKARRHHARLKRRTLAR
jgi:predicted RNA-binding Zn ribbon-like protein